MTVATYHWFIALPITRFWVRSNYTLEVFQMQKYWNICFQIKYLSSVFLGCVKVETVSDDCCYLSLIYRLVYHLLLSEKKLQKQHIRGISRSQPKKCDFSCLCMLCPYLLKTFVCHQIFEAWKKSQNSNVEWDRLHGEIEVMKLKIRNFCHFFQFLLRGLKQNSMN